MRNRNFFLLALVGMLGAFFADNVQGFCPVCVVAVGAGLELSHYLGIDDTITGLWIGALLVSLSAWTVEWFEKKNIRFRRKKVITYGAYYILTLFPLYWYGFMGQDNHFFWGVDKLLLGIVLGSIAFFFGGMLNSKLKKQNGGKVYFPFQKVVVPVGLLLVLSFIFYFLTR